MPLLLLLLCATLVAEDTAALRAHAGRVLGTPDPATIDYPAGFPPTPAEVVLGRMLFFDPRLSASGTISCATCHNPDLGLGDGLAKGQGTHAQARNTPPLYNLAWAPVLFWDGRSPSLEDQALQPIQAPGEMALPLPQLLARLNAIEGYRAGFRSAFGDEAVTGERVAGALANFQRTLVVRDTAYDRWQAGDDRALGPEARRGLALFLGKADCTSCHSGPHFTDFSFHRLGLPDADRGRGAVVPGAASEKAFRTPGLRNVALTAPYLHDGSVATLEDVVRLYDRGGGPGADPLLKPLHLRDDEVRDLVAFLGALTQPLAIERPALPSGSVDHRPAP